MLKRRSRRSRWQRIVSALAAVVVFVTTYALIIPAITLEVPPDCGLEEHVHDPGKCYDDSGLLTCTKPEHTHTEQCSSRAYRGSLDRIALSMLENTTEKQAKEQELLEAREREIEAERKAAEVSTPAAERETVEAATAPVQIEKVEATAPKEASPAQEEKDWVGVIDNTPTQTTGALPGQYEDDRENVTDIAETALLMDFTIEEATLFADEPEYGWVMVTALTGLKAADGPYLIVSGNGDSVRALNYSGSGGNLSGNQQGLQITRSPAKTGLDGYYSFTYNSGTVPQSALWNFSTDNNAKTVTNAAYPAIGLNLNNDTWLNTTTANVTFSLNNDAFRLRYGTNGRYLRFNNNNYSRSSTSSDLYIYKQAVLPELEEEKWKLVTSTDDLVAGEEYLIVAPSGTDKALKDVNEQVAQTSDVTITSLGNGLYTIGGYNLNKWTLGGSSNSYTLKNGSRYISPSNYNNSATYRRAVDSSSSNLTIGTTVGGNTTISRTYGSNRYYLAYSNDTFTGSSSNTSTVRLYKKVSEVTVTFDYGAHASELSPSYTTHTMDPGQSLNDEGVGLPEVTWDDPDGSWEIIGYVIHGTDTPFTADTAVNGNITVDAVYGQILHNVSYDLGEYEDDYEEMGNVRIPHGSILSEDFTAPPAWDYDTEHDPGSTPMPFYGWYLDDAFTTAYTGQPITEDTVLYARWGSLDSAYYVHWMDFERDGSELRSVKMTYPVPAGQSLLDQGVNCTPRYVPDRGFAWDGKWYYDPECTQEFDTSTVISTDSHLTGVDYKDLYLYPGKVSACRVLYVTLGMRIPPVTLAEGDMLTLPEPERLGYEFTRWYLDEECTQVAGENGAAGETITVEPNVENETGNYMYLYAGWEPDYVPFSALTYTENEDDYNFTSAGELGTWYALAGSTIRVVTTASGNTRTHRVYCIPEGGTDADMVPVYTNAALTQQATIPDVHSDYFVFNNADDPNADYRAYWQIIKDHNRRVQMPYSTAQIEPNGTSVVHFNYMRVRINITFNISDNSAYMNFQQLVDNGIIPGTAVVESTSGYNNANNHAAHGVFEDGIQWDYTPRPNYSSSNNVLVFRDVKYNQTVAAEWPVAVWFTCKTNGQHFASWQVQTYNGAGASGGNGQSSKRISAEPQSCFYNGYTGRQALGVTYNASFGTSSARGIMYAFEMTNEQLASGITPSYTTGGKSYLVDRAYNQLIYNGSLSAKPVKGMGSGTKLSAASEINKVKPLYTSTYAADFGNLTESQFAGFDFFIYNRIRTDIKFNFNDGTGSSVTYEVKYQDPLEAYKYAMPDGTRHAKLTREGYRFVGWHNAAGEMMTDEDWEELINRTDTEGDTMIFEAVWEPINGNIVQYYKSRYFDDPVYTATFEDGEYFSEPDIGQFDFPEEFAGWEWDNSDKQITEEFYDDYWSSPMYGAYGVQEEIGLKEDGVTPDIRWVVKLYGMWLNNYIHVYYDANVRDGGIASRAPVDPDTYDVGTKFPVAHGMTTAENTYGKVFVGWKLDADGNIYQPGNHILVDLEWLPSVTLKAQWANADQVVYLKYDGNGATPNSEYPNAQGFTYLKDSNAVVWDNRGVGTDYYTKTGYRFASWNTRADGTGDTYAADSIITLSDNVTVLYAQWVPDVYDLSITKVFRDSGGSYHGFGGAEFALYELEGGVWSEADTGSVSTDGALTLEGLSPGKVYKLLETHAPDGYYSLTEPICFRVTVSGGSVVAVPTDEEGNTLADWPDSIVLASYSEVGGVLSMDVENESGFELPETGGSGTKPYTLCGIALIVIALVYGSVSRRRRERRFT